MRNLLSAGYFRLWRSWEFWLCAALILSVSVLSMLNGCRMAMAYAESELYTLDHFYWETLPFIGPVCAIFSGLFLGTEYSDGAVRNKLIAGHTRLSVYLSNLILCFFAALFYTGAVLLGGLVGLFFLGPLHMPLQTLALYLLICVLIAASFSAICTFVGMFCSNRAIGAVGALLLIIGLLIWASVLYNALCEPELYSGVVMTADGMQMGDPAPNPAYIGGALRKVYEFLLDLLPTGQGILLANSDAARPLRMALCSAALTLAVTTGGAALFRRKDLK